MGKAGAVSDTGLDAMRRGRRQLVESSSLRFGVVTFALLFGLCAVFAVSTPIGSSPDEHVQIVRAASAARGDPGGAMTETPSPGPGLPNHLEYVVTIPRSYAEVLELPACYAFKPEVAAACAPILDDDARPTQATTYVGSYPPPYYAVVGLPSLILPADHGVYVMRLVSAVLVAALFTLGFVAARRLGGGVLVAAVAVLVTPVAVYLGGTVNPSGVEIAAGFATWLTALGLLRSRPGGDGPGAVPLWCCTLATATLLVTRPSGLLVVAVIAATVLTAVGSRQGVESLMRHDRVRLAAVLLVIVAVLTGAWIIHADALGTFLGIPLPGVTRADALGHILTDHLNLLRQMIGVFGWLDVTLPDPVWWSWGLAALAVVAVGFVVADARRRVAMAVALGLGVIAPPLTQLRDVERYGYIWSGRYSLPFAMGLVVLAGWAIAQRVERPRSPMTTDMATTDRASSGAGAGPAWRTGVRGGAVAIGVIAATGLITSYVVVMQRFATGIVSGRFDYLRHARWQPPLHPVATTAAVVVLATAWGTWIAVHGMTSVRNRTAVPL